MQKGSPYKKSLNKEIFLFCIFLYSDQKILHIWTLFMQRFLKLPLLHKILKQMSPSLHRTLAPRTFTKLSIVFSTNVTLLYLLYSTAQRCCLQQSIKINCLLKTFLRTLILMTWVSLYLYLFYISVILKMVRTVITNLDLSKASGDCIPMVVLKNCKLKLSYITSLKNL